MVDVRIIIAALNSEILLKNCIESIYKNTNDYQFEVVVIDNGSTDNTVKMVQQNFADINIIQNPKNQGVARARNQGLKEINARYALILDADTVVKENAINLMIDFMDKNKQAGICGAKLLSPEGDLQLTCRSFHNALIPVLRRLTFLSIVKNSGLLKRFLMADWDHNSPRQVDHVIGACQLIRKEVIDKIGLLDRRMFYGWEDTDYCVRNKRAGFQTWYFPNSIVIHYEQRITKKKFFSRLFFENLKSMFIFFAKYPTGLFGKY